MTKDEAFIRIDRLATNLALAIEPDRVNDARRLVEVLPDQALLPLVEGWIRPEPIQGDQIEFFWSRSANITTRSTRSRNFADPLVMGFAMWRTDFQASLLRRN